MKSFFGKTIRNMLMIIGAVVLLCAVMSTDAYAKEKIYSVNGEKIRFDAEYYAATYADVKNALGTGEKALLNHYITYGRNEGRSPYANANVLSNAQIEKELLTQINDIRKKAGKGNLTLSTELNSVATVRVKEMTKSYSHTRPNGTDFVTAFTAVNAKYADADNQVAENVVTVNTKGKNSIEAATAEFNTLKNSTDHYNRMTSSDFNYIGIASCQVGDKNYTVFEFSTK